MYALNPLQSWILIIGLIVLAVLLVTSVLGSPFDPIDEPEDEGLDKNKPVFGSDVDWQAVPPYGGTGSDEIYDWSQRGL